MEENEEMKPCCKVCGQKMKFIEFISYYEIIYYFDFSCDCNDNTVFKVDGNEFGAYAR